MFGWFIFFEKEVLIYIYTRVATCTKCFFKAIIKAINQIFDIVTNEFTTGDCVREVT